ncbi:MAG TPA: T9SS type A sorting domain-containing protein [Puia sp.]|nr:T9SS type A sorting domain-containing protein [Puia sp.]
MGNLCLCVILSAVFSLSSSAQKMVTYDTTFGGWNAIVTADVALQGTDSAAGIVFFPGIGEMTTNIADLAKNGPHYLINNGLWDGSVTLGNGVHHPFIISLQPPGCCYPANSVKPMIDAILKRYRIKRNSFYMTGLSQGGWQANQFICYETTPGDDTYGRMVKALVVLEGVEPADSTGIYPSLSYPRKMGHWARACGGRELWVEGSQDWRDMLAGAQNMNDSVAASATYFQVTYGGGAHCCWNTEYQPGTTWTIPSNPNISQLVGTPESMNVWQWLLRQGDTTLPASESGGAVPPTVNAGSGQTVTLPTSSTTLSGTAVPGGAAAISSSSWTQVSGPGSATIGSVVNSFVSKVTGLLSTVTGTTDTLSTTVSALVAGTYVFKLTVTDNDGLASSSTVTIVVNSPAAGVPPTVSAGKGQVITLPANSTTLTGTAAGNGGATISGVTWKQSSGPAAVTIASASSLSTAVSGITTAGSYVFTLYATDNNGRSSNGSMTVTVNAATANKPPTVSAGKGQVITLPAISTTLTGSATGNNGATIAGLTWKQSSGPATVTIGSASSLSTAVTGMSVAGSYVFTLYATDNNGNSANGSMTVTVYAAGTTANSSPAVPRQAMAFGDSASAVDSAIAGRTGEVQLYPNPVHDLLNIYLHNEAAGKVVIAIYNGAGSRVVLSEAAKDGVVLLRSIDVSGLPKGLYVVQVVTGAGSRSVGKFIKL